MFCIIIAQNHSCTVRMLKLSNALRRLVGTDWNACWSYWWGLISRLDRFAHCFLKAVCHYFENRIQSGLSNDDWGYTQAGHTLNSDPHCHSSSLRGQVNSSWSPAIMYVVADDLRWASRSSVHSAPHTRQRRWSRVLGSIWHQFMPGHRRPIGPLVDMHLSFLKTNKKPDIHTDARCCWSFLTFARITRLCWS